MPNTKLTKSSSDSDSMQLTTEQKEKFLAYLEKKGLPAPASSLIPNRDQEETDLVSWCIEDISKGLKKEGVELSDEDKKNLLLDLIFTTIDFIVTQKDDERLGDLDGLIECMKVQNTMDDFQALIALYWGIYPYFGIAFSKSFAANYTKKCLDLQITPNPAYTNLIFNF